MVATAGVAFALTLMFMQLGFLGSVVNTATLITDQLDFDIALVAPDYKDIGAASSFPLARLYEAKSVPGVAAATPFYVGLQLWRSELAGGRGRVEPGEHLGKNRAIMVLGLPVDAPVLRLDPSGRPFPIRVAPEDLERLRLPGTLLIDSKSHPSFEPRQPVASVQVGGRRLRVEGQYSLGISFAADGSVLVSDQTFSELFPGSAPGLVSVGLIKVAPAHAGRIDEVAERVRRALTDERGQGITFRRDVRVLTRPELTSLEIAYWKTDRSIGLIFLMGVAVALIIGVVVVYQVLSGDIMDHYKEYATLKAMGYTNRYLGMVVVQQGLLLSLFGYLPAIVAAYGLYGITRSSQNLPIAMTGQRAAIVLAMSSLMCVAAALLSVRRVTASDPANLF
jgi:putative ABC transport system permease protein